jgi:hypothetical protein
MTEAEAIAKAKEVVEGSGWPWIEPIAAFSLTEKQQRFWRIVTCSDARGPNAWAEFNAETGELLGKGYIPR